MSVSHFNQEKGPNYALERVSSAKRASTKAPGAFRYNWPPPELQVAALAT